MDKKVISSAIGKWGYETVNSIIEMVDEKGTYRTYMYLTDSGMQREVECLMELYNLSRD